MALMRCARAAAVAAVLLSMAGCGLQQQVAGGSGGTAEDTPAPAVNGVTVTGKPLSWSSLRGHTLLLDFWGSWCGPCRAEQASINHLWHEYAARGVVFLGVDMRDDDAAALAYERDYSVPYPSVADSSETIAAAYDVAAPPTIVIVDRHGDIVGTYLGTVVGVSDELDHIL